MALFTDSDIICLADLVQVDPEVPQVALAENIVVSGYGSIINNAVTISGHELVARYQNFSGYLTSAGYNIAHLAAVQNTMQTAINRPRFRLNQMTATEPDPSSNHYQRWLVYAALEHFYAAAFRRFNKSADRYQAKMEYFGGEAKKRWATYIAAGAAIVLVPMPCPGALREFNAGTFTSANVSAGGSGSGDPGGNIYLVAVTWISQNSPYGAGYVNPGTKNNSESGGSAQVQQAVAAGQYLTVSIANLNPPNNNNPPQVGTADGLYQQMTATGWNVYVGKVLTQPNPPAPQLPPATLYLQNSTPLPLTQTSYTLAGAPALTGQNALTTGQFPDYRFQDVNIVHRV